MTLVFRAGLREVIVDADAQSWEATCSKYWLHYSNAVLCCPRSRSTECRESTVRLRSRFIICIDQLTFRVIKFEFGFIYQYVHIILTVE
jgi:hypothetical protein